MKPLLYSVIAVATLLQGGSASSFTGTITDSMCADANHGRMRMGPTDAECVAACVEAHDATYVLYDGTNTYELSDQRAPPRFAARKVTITGTLDTKTKTIHVESITAAP
jgi:hypothetical protein